MTLTNPANLVVVITGCDTGFGSEITEDLYQRGGFTIYATCLTEQAVEKYNARQSSRIRALQVDVTKQQDVERLRAQVEAECPQGVFCVFNNAGTHTDVLLAQILVTVPTTLPDVTLTRLLNACA